jgi:hypothetical protein
MIFSLNIDVPAGHAKLPGYLMVIVTSNSFHTGDPDAEHRTAECCIGPLVPKDPKDELSGLRAGKVRRSASFLRLPVAGGDRGRKGGRPLMAQLHPRQNHLWK